MCYNKAVYLASRFNNYRKHIKYITIKMKDCQNVEPTTVFCVYFIVILVSKMKNQLKSCYF